MRTFLDMPVDHPERDDMVSLLRNCGFLVIPHRDSMNTALYFAYRHIDTDEESLNHQSLNDFGLTIVTIGEFDDCLPHHISPSGPVFIDIRSRRIVSPIRPS